MIQSWKNMTTPYIFIYTIYNIVFHFFPVDLLGSRHRAPCPAPVSPVKTCDVAPSDFEARHTNSALRCCCRSSRFWPIETWGRSTNRRYHGYNGQQGSWEAGVRLYSTYQYIHEGRRETLHNITIHSWRVVWVTSHNHMQTCCCKT